MNARKDLHQLVSELLEWALPDVSHLLAACLDAGLPWSRLQSVESEDEPLSPAEFEALQNW